MQGDTHDPGSLDARQAPLPSAPVLVTDDDADVDSTLEQNTGLRRIGVVVNWNHSPSFTDVSVLVNAEGDVRPGQFLGVLHHRRAIPAVTVVQVGNSFEVNPSQVPELAAARRALGLDERYGSEGVSTRIFRLAECATVEEFSYHLGPGGLKVEGNGKPPELLTRAGDTVVTLPPDIVIWTIGGLPDPQQGLSLGRTVDAEPVDVTLRPDAFQYHIGDFGNPGKGKSYLAGNLLEEAVAWQIPSLVLDINGEFVKTARQLGGKVITLPNRSEFGLSLDLMTPLELVAITPNVQLGTQYAELIELAQDQLRTEARGRPISFDMLRERIGAIGESTKTTGSSVRAAIARVSTLQKDPLVGGEFDFVKQLDEHRLVVLDCRYLSLRQTRLIAAMGARELQRIGRERARAAEEHGDKEAAGWFALYFVDEAHSVIPDDEKSVSTQVFFELARMGRHVRTGLVLSSQSPADLNPSVLKRLQLRFVFALERDQLRSIHGVIADLDEKIIAQLPKLPRGICAVSGSSELVRHGFLLDVRERRTHVGGGTPPVFGARIKRALAMEENEDV